MYCSCACAIILCYYKKKKAGKKKKREACNDICSRNLCLQKPYFKLSRKYLYFWTFFFQIWTQNMCNMNRSLCFKDRKATRKWIPAKKKNKQLRICFLLKSNKTCISDGGFMYMNYSLCFSNSLRICQNMLTLHENAHTRICIRTQTRCFSIIHVYTHTHKYINKVCIEYTHINIL